MIKNNESRIKITTRNIKYYTDKNYNCKIGDIISININSMPMNSHNKVIAICELCKNEIELEFSKYNRNKNRHGYYSCLNCSNYKRVITMNKKYGVDNYSQCEKAKKNNMKWMSSKEFKEKAKKTIKEKYNVEHYSKTQEFKISSSIKNKQTIKEKKIKGIYKCSLSSRENQKLKEEGMLKKYGEKYSFLVPEIKEKITSKKNFNRKRLIEKSNNSIKLGISYNKEEFKIYRMRVRYLTDKIREKLFKNWDGYDYYDGEFIKENLKLNYNNSQYPTIDHKISCFKGFIENIPVEKIANIDNLCITKRNLNGKKSHNNLFNF